jgi:hypothetical protein
MKTVQMASSAALMMAGSGFICPAVSELVRSGSLPLAGVALLLLGISLALGGGMGLWRGVRLSRA